MSSLTHAMEDILTKLRSKDLIATPEIMNVLFEAVDLLEILAKKIGEGKEEDIEITGVIQNLRQFVAADDKVQVSAGERRQSLQLRYLESEKEQIAAALQEDQKFYHVDISLMEDCLLKGCGSI